jgi:hypothetical protein
MTALIALALAVLIGLLLVRLTGLTQGLRPRWAAALCRLALGAGAGVAVTSSVFYLLLRTGMASRGSVLGAELFLLAVLGFAQRYRLRTAETRQRELPRFRFNGVLAGGAAAALALLIATQVSMVRAAPHGNWDAFAIWNLRAKFLLAPGELWKNAASPLLERTHPEYPLLLSAFVARTWRLSGTVSPAAPLATGYLFTAGVAALLLAVSAIARGTAAGLLASLLFFASTSYLEQISWQYADIPLSFYFLATFGALVLGVFHAGRQAVLACALAGLCAGFAALTKNEGTAFLVFSSLALAASLAWARGAHDAWRRLRWWLAGALPGLALLADFRLFLAPPVNLLRDQTLGQILEKLTDSSRLLELGKALLAETVALGDGWSHPLILLGLLAAVLRFEFDDDLRVVLRAAGATLAGLWLVYAAVFLVRPEELAWLVGTALGRLYAHLWPSFLLLAFLVLGRPADPAPSEQALRRRKKAR